MTIPHIPPTFHEDHLQATQGMAGVAVCRQQQLRAAHGRSQGRHLTLRRRCWLHGAWLVVDLARVEIIGKSKGKLY